jgi:hypothetical protein
MVPGPLLIPGFILQYFDRVDLAQGVVERVQKNEFSSMMDAGA